MKLNQRLNHLIVALTLASFALWIVSIQQTRLTIGVLGFIHSLPITYFASLTLLTISFIFSIRSITSRSMLFVELILLILLLRLTPILIERTPGLYAWHNYGPVDYVTRNGNLNPFIVSYHNWPGFSILFTTFTNIIGLDDPTPLLTIAPVLFDVLYLFPLYSFFNCTMEKNEGKKWVAIWLFYLINWTGQDYFSPQALALFFYIIILSLLFSLLKHSNYKTFNAHIKLVSLVIFYFTLVISHFLTSFAILVVVVLPTIFSYIVRKDSSKLNLILLLITMYFSWTIFQAVVYFQPRITSYIGEIFNFSRILQESLLHQMTGGSKSLAMVAQFRVIFSVLVAFFTLLGFFISWKFKKKSFNEESILCLVALFLLILLFPYGGEMIIRVYMFSLLFALYFIAENLNHKKTMVCLFIFLFLAPPLHIIACHGNEVYEYVPSSAIKGAEFFYDKASQPSYIICSGNSLDMFKDVEFHKYISFHENFPLTWKDGLLVPETLKLNIQWKQYIWIMGIDRRYYHFYRPWLTEFIEELPNRLGNSPYYNKIYTNPEFDMYFMACY